MKDTRKLNLRSMFPMLATALALSACGGGDSTSTVAVPAAPAVTLSGTAAVGVPIVGAGVNVSCAGGSALTATTSATGTWQVTISGQTLPCAVRVSGGQVNGAPQGTPYHSIAVSFGTLNVTPLTDLVVATLTRSNPQTWFNNPTFAAVNGPAVTAALNTVTTALGVGGKLGSANPFTSVFQAQNGDLIDDVLEAFRLAMAAISSNHAALLAAAGNADFSAFTGFGPAFNIAHVNLTGGMGGTGGTGTTGSVTVEVTAVGVTTTVVVPGVAAPGSQTEFCAGIQNDSSLTALTAAGGTLTINSCSFTGNVGNVVATLTISVPIVFSTSYTVKYTFN